MKAEIDLAFRAALAAFLGREVTEAEARAEVVARAIGEMKDDIEDGVLPRSVASFAELHDHVDANGYGGAFDFDVLSGEACHGLAPDTPDHDALLERVWSFWNAVQHECDRLIRAGALRMG
jgi:hypothetical protein